MHNNSVSGGTDHPPTRPPLLQLLLTLAQSYGRSVQECLEAWKSDQELGMADKAAKQANTVRWMLLWNVYSFMHLPEIYLPLKSTALWKPKDPLQVSGYVTSATVRYLRLFVLPTAEDSLTNPSKPLRRC